MLTRLAPTPSGYLHQGNAFNFLHNWLMARKAGGQVLLRIDDLDAPRARQEYIVDVFETLDWLGMDYDLGPNGPDALASEWSQNQRLPLYNKMLGQLKSGGHLFACTCSRKDLQVAGETYADACLAKNLSFDLPDVTWRLRVAHGTIVTVDDGWQGRVAVNLAEAMGSFAVRRKDGIPAYQIASLADDVHFGVTHVLRGQDLMESTAAQQHLARLLGLPQFEAIRFYHHPLVADAAGQKLSKSKGSIALHQWRQEGVQASKLLTAYCQWAGLPYNNEPTTAADLVLLA